MLYRRKNTAIFWSHASAKVITAEKLKTAYRQKITAVLHCRRKHTAIFWFTASTKVVTAEMKNRLPSENYRCIALQPKEYAIFWFTASAKVVIAKKEKTANRLKITSVWQYRPVCFGLKNRHRRPIWFVLIMYQYRSIHVFTTHVQQTRLLNCLG